jgi:glutathione-regulated potassium-efflux system ancillary protein KefC
MDGFLQQALVYLGAGVIGVLLFKRLGLGSVLGYLVAGIAIGPWGLKLISDPQTVLHFAEFGVVLLLFLVGLELSPARVWALRRSILGLGGTQVLATIAAVAGIAALLGQPLAVGLIAGMAFAMSSTAIGLASLTERNLLATPGGQASFSVLLFQDLAVIPMLLAVGYFTGERGGGLGWIAALKAAGFIAALVVAGRFVIRPLLRYVAQTRLREVFVGFSLLLVLGTAALSEAVGLSMALGAFLAGVMLADSEYRHELELDIDPFKGLLLGLFFMAVGMSVDVGLFARAPHLVLGVALGLVLLKAAMLYPVAKAFGYCGSADAAIFALALSQAGEFAFVLFAAAGPLLPPETAALLNAAVAVSMLTTPLLMIAYDRLLVPRLHRAEARPDDEIHESNPVIIAGFGRFGQVLVRVLRGLGVGATVIDHDPNQIELVRRFGFKAYYGDATRMNLLESAGIARARLFVLAIDDPKAAREAAERVRARYPELKILARARARTDAFEFAEMGVPVVRELLGGALEASVELLKMLGYTEEASQRIAQRFREHDDALFAQMAAHRNDMGRLIALSAQGRSDLERVLSAEIHQNNPGADEQRRDEKPQGERLPQEKHA